MNTDDAWRPRCGACGSTSMQARTVTREGADPAVSFYECTACGRAWDGSEAPEPISVDDLADVIEQMLDQPAHSRHGEDETDEQFAARIRASMTDPRKDH